jgi:acylpyruvate hydrolase
MFMKLVTFAGNGDPGSLGRPSRMKAGALLNTTEILDFSLAQAVPSLPSLARWIPDSIVEILKAGQEGLDFVRKVVDEVEEGSESIREALRDRGALLPLAKAHLLAPVPRPTLVLSTGMNYRQHLREMGTPPPPEPMAFIKTSGAVIGPETPIVLPPQFSDMVDFEGEFSFIFGKTCHNVSAKDGMDYVAGYTIVNDVSARNWAAGTQTAKEPMEAVHAWWVNLMGKQLPTFCPMGPCLVTREEIPDPHNLELITTLNGKVMQSANTNDLIFKLPDLIAYFSKWYRFQPGDVITTGSPSGVGFARNPKIFMKAGDVVAIKVEGVGTLSNPIISGS